MEIPKGETLQIIMANQPRMLREMLSHIFNHTKQVNVIGEVTHVSQLPLLVELMNPSWVVLTLCENGSFPDVADEIIDRDPDVGILAFSANGGCARARFRNMTFEGMALGELIQGGPQAVDVLGGNGRVPIAEMSHERAGQIEGQLERLDRLVRGQV